MNVYKFTNLFNHYCKIVHNLNKVPTKSSHCKRSKGNRLLRSARKYRRPEDLVDPFYYGEGPKPEIKSLSQSIAARGFAKEQISYTPPPNVEEQLHNICQKLLGSELSEGWRTQPLDDMLVKYKVLNKCIETFKKNVPNSVLHKMRTAEDLVAFFNEPVQGLLHYDALVRDADLLPPNFHLMPDTPAFNPETDTFFDGVTAFPGRKRILHTKTGNKFEKIVEWPHV